MNIAITILVFAVIFSIFRSHLKFLKESYFNKLESIVDKIELSIVKNNVVINNDVKFYIRAFRTYLVNQKLADIQVMLAIRKLIPDDKWDSLTKKGNELRSYLPQETIELESEFNIYFGKIIFLSILKIDFIFLVLVVSFKRLFKSGFKGIKSAYDNARRSIQDEILIGGYSRESLHNHKLAA